MPRFAEFFSGAGMVRSALNADWDLAFANDIDPKKCRAYRMNWGDGGLVQGDVRDLDRRLLRQPIDLYWASSPCQDLSLAGARRGLAGKRSGVFFDWMDLVAEAVQSGFAPRILAFENVTGLINSNSGKDFEEVARCFNVHGYRFGAVEIDARHFLPQSRPRVFMVGVRQDVEFDQSLVLPFGTGCFHTDRLRRFAAQLPENLRSNWVWWNVPLPSPRKISLLDVVDLHFPIPISREETKNIMLMMDAPSLRKIEAAQNEGGVKVGTIYKRGRPAENGLVRQRAEVRFDGLAGCLRTPAGGSSRQTLVVVRDGSVSMRLLTAREAMRLMGMPESYVLPSSYNEAYKLAGDGVAVPVVRHLAETVFQRILAAPSRLAAA